MIAIPNKRDPFARGTLITLICGVIYLAFANIGGGTVQPAQAQESPSPTQAISSGCRQGRRTALAHEAVQPAGRWKGNGSYEILHAPWWCSSCLQHCRESSS